MGYMNPMMSSVGPEEFVNNDYSLTGARQTSKLSKPQEGRTHSIEGTKDTYLKIMKNRDHFGSQKKIVMGGGFEVQAHKKIPTMPMMVNGRTSS
mmetsp:Transcript_13703/g.17325  ORF Transcript_13703/g.17325 Transcript_13703/m.17325 type:complete len:94 (+) Transcript_13703:1441-1722(+)